MKYLRLALLSVLAPDCVLLVAEESLWDELIKREYRLASERDEVHSLCEVAVTGVAECTV